MSNYDPKILAAKWDRPLSEWLSHCQARWEDGRPRKRWFSFRLPERDSSLDQITPHRDLRILAYDGRVVFGHVARAFFPAYIPGRQTHYGSVVYAEDPACSEEVFTLAWRVNELRRDREDPPAGTEKVADAIRDDRSEFASIELPPALGVGRKRFFANLCLQRNRLPMGYIHSRLVPILIQPECTPWCCLLPLRFWDPDFVRTWVSAAPAYAPEPFISKCRHFGIVA